MILGTQWYILFNVIGGINPTMPAELQFAAQEFRRGRAGCGGGKWRLASMCCRPTSPASVTASGGSWNASIVSEIVKWGDTTLTATGIGAYIARKPRRLKRYAARCP